MVDTIKVVFELVRKAFDKGKSTSRTRSILPDGKVLPDNLGLLPTTEATERFRRRVEAVLGSLLGNIMYDGVPWLPVPKQAIVVEFADDEGCRDLWKQDKSWLEDFGLTFADHIYVNYEGSELRFDTGHGKFLRRFGFNELLDFTMYEVKPKMQNTFSSSVQDLKAQRNTHLAMEIWYNQIRHWTR